MDEMGEAARKAARALRNAPAEQRSAAIRAMAKHVVQRSADILEANAQDLAGASTMIDRLMLDQKRIEAIAAALNNIAALPDPVGKIIETWVRPNGLEISRVRIPIGVIGMIFESRPNVTADAAGIAIRSANAVILRSGSEAAAQCACDWTRHCCRDSTKPSFLRPASRWFATADRDAVGLMLQGLEGSIDLIIPRGGRALVERVTKDARVPVLGHLEGVCHTYVHRSANAQYGRKHRPLCKTSPSRLLRSNGNSAHRPAEAARLFSLRSQRLSTGANCAATMRPVKLCR